MRSIRNILSVILILLACDLTAGGKHELSVYVGGGMSTLHTDMSRVFDIDNKHKAGGSAGIEYAYNISPMFAIKTGAEFTLYSSEYSLNATDGNFVTPFGEGDRIIFDYYLSGYKEKTRATYLNIPVMLRFNLPVSESLKWFVAGGFKVGFKIDAEYKNSYATLRTTGIYVEDGVLSDRDPLTDIPEKGFGTFAYGRNKGGVDLRVMCAVVAETGLNYSFNSRYSISCGAYFAYGLNNIRKSAGNSFVQYDGLHPEKPEVNGMLNSVNKRYLEAVPLADKIKPMTLGVKLGFTYHF